MSGLIRTRLRGVVARVCRLVLRRVGWSATLGAWARRDAVLMSCLAAAAALAGLSGPLGVPWLAVAGAIIAAAGGLPRLVINVQRARLEGRRERVESVRRLRVPVAPIGGVDPTLIGVDPAAQTVLAGGVLPDYVGARSARRCVTRSRQRWMVGALACGRGRGLESRQVPRAV